MTYFLDKKEKIILVGSSDLKFPEHIDPLSDSVGKTLWEGVIAGGLLELDTNGAPYLMPAPPLTDDETDALRRQEYNAETDPLVMEVIREIFADDPRMEEVNKKVAEIKARYPKPTSGI